MRHRQQVRRGLPKRRLWALACAGVVLLGVGVIGVRIWQVRSALDATADAARDLRAAGASGDVTASQVARFEDAAALAEKRTSGWLWGSLTHLPITGDDAAALRALSHQMRLLAGHVQPLLDIRDQESALLPHSGRLDLDEISALGPPLTSADRALAAAQQDLARYQPDDLIGALQSPWRSLLGELDDVSTAVDIASRAVQVLPDALGADGPRHYLVVFQNNAEARSTGGLPGAAALLTADDGALSLDAQEPGGDLVTPEPVLALTTTEKRIYGPLLGTDFRDANWTPDFGRSAELWRAHWTTAHPGPVDGVLSLDPVALSYLLEATGSIDVDGTTLTADNAVQQLLSGVYARYPDPDQQDAWFQQVVSTFFASLTGGRADASELIDQMQRGVAERRILFHSFSPSVQEVVAGSRLSGDLPSTTTVRPQIGVYLSDVTASKMSYYLRPSVRITDPTCRDGVEQFDVRVTLRSTLRPDQAAGLPDYVAGGFDPLGLVRGSQMVAVRLFAPAFGDITGVVRGQTPVQDPPVDAVGGRPLNVTYVSVDPGTTGKVTWHVTAGSGQRGAAEVRVTPGVVNAPVSLSAGIC